jgi:hypothetical protein
MRILVINCGSATLKYALYETAPDSLERLASATVPWEGGYGAAVGRALASLPLPPDAVAHRRPDRRHLLFWRSPWAGFQPTATGSSVRCAGQLA